MIFFKNYKSCFFYIYNNIEPKKNIIISGGSTVKSILRYCNNKYNLKNNKILLTDERLVPNNSNLRNDNFFYKLIKNKLINKKNFLHYPFSYFSEQKLNNFNNVIKKINFDYAIVSLGKDNHIASIFPKNNNININKEYYFIENSPKRPKKRVTISLKKIKKSKKIFLIANRNKRIDDLKKIKTSKIYKSLKKKLILIIVGSSN
jgi:6-phosphogluconolactonase/glucosamine-6-phosphate isomerase/deaminase